MRLPSPFPVLSAALALLMPLSAAAPIAVARAQDGATATAAAEPAAGGFELSILLGFASLQEALAQFLGTVEELSIEAEIKLSGGNGSIKAKLEFESEEGEAEIKVKLRLADALSLLQGLDQLLAMLQDELGIDISAVLEAGVSLEGDDDDDGDGPRRRRGELGIASGQFGATVVREGEREHGKGRPDRIVVRSANGELTVVPREGMPQWALSATSTATAGMSATIVTGLNRDDDDDDDDEDGPGLAGLRQRIQGDHKDGKRRGRDE